MTITPAMVFWGFIGIAALIAAIVALASERRS